MITYPPEALTRGERIIPSGARPIMLDVHKPEGLVSVTIHEGGVLTIEIEGCLVCRVIHLEELQIKGRDFTLIPKLR